jgi:hypothetical protein
VLRRWSALGPLPDRARPTRADSVGKSSPQIDGRRGRRRSAASEDLRAENRRESSCILKNRDIYDRIMVRVRGVKEAVARRGFVLRGKTIRSSGGAEFTLPDYLNARVEDYAFSRRGNCRSVSREISEWGYLELRKTVG